MRILTLDDNLDDLFALGRFLRKLFGRQVQIHQTQQPSEAEELLSGEAFDALILDLNLKKSSGLDFLTSQAERDSRMPLPTIVLTGSDSEDEAVHALSLGAHDYLRKEDLNEASLKRAISFAQERYQMQVVWAERNQALREENERLQSANEITMQLVAGASHELRTPVTAILGVVEMLESRSDESLQSNELKPLVASLRACSESLLLTVDDIIDLAKAEVQQLSLNPTGFLLKPELESVIESMRFLSESRSLTLSLELSDEAPETVYTDSRRLRQVLHNLLGNAIKFTHEGGITLRVERSSPTQVTFSVIDTGIGIPPDALDDIFVPHHRVKGEAPGSGLGLTVCTTIVEALGGKLQVESTLGQGTKFFFSLNVPAASKTNLNGKSEDEEVHLPPTRMLLVEDNRFISRVLAAQLRRLGHSVEVAEDGLEAMSILSDSQDFDIVLMDCQMPRLDGYSATTRIREELGLKIPIIALSADGLDAHRKRGLEAGMDDFIVKPISLPKLLLRIGSLLSSAEAEL